MSEAFEGLRLSPKEIDSMRQVQTFDFTICAPFCVNAREKVMNISLLFQTMGK